MIGYAKLNEVVWILLAGYKYQLMLEVVGIKLAAILLINIVYNIIIVIS